MDAGRWYKKHAHAHFVCATIHPIGPPQSWATRITGSLLTSGVNSQYLDEFELYEHLPLRRRYCVHVGPVQQTKLSGQFIHHRIPAVMKFRKPCRKTTVGHCPSKPHSRTSPTSILRCPRSSTGQSSCHAFGSTNSESVRSYHRWYQLAYRLLVDISII